jgi:hypothetical protein
MQFLPSLFACVFAPLFIKPTARADQHAYISRTIAERAVAHLTPGTLVVLHGVRKLTPLWRIEEAIIAVTDDDDLVEIRLLVRRLFEAPGSSENLATARWAAVSTPEGGLSLEHVDLAYLHVPQRDGSFRVLADILRLLPLAPPYNAPVRLPATLLALMHGAEWMQDR